MDCFASLAMTGSGSALPRWDIPDTGRVLGNIVEAVGEMHAFVRWRPFIDRQSRPPFLRRPDRPWDESATAVWAHIVEFVLDAVRTERAFITADARFHG